MQENVTDVPEYSMEQKNKRCSTRAALIVEKLPCEDGQKTFFGYANNISRGGLFISTVNPREPGEEFIIEFTLTGKTRHTFRCRCTVVWKRHFLKKSPAEPGMGLKFLDLNADDGDKLEAWVTAQAVRQF